MANLLKQGQALIAATLKSHGSETVTYRRGANSVSIAASVGRPDMTLGPEFGGGHLRMNTKEFVITAADLVINGVAVSPATGDMIDVAEGEATNRYRVGPDGGLPEFENADAFGIMLRIRGTFQGAV